MSVKSWREIAQENQDLVTAALEKLADVEHERDRALEQRDQAEHQRDAALAVLAEIMCSEDDSEDDD